MGSFALLLMIAGQADWPNAGYWAIGRFDERCVTSLEYEGAGATEQPFTVTVPFELEAS